MRAPERKRLLVDVDEVLADFQTPVLKLMTRILGRQIRADDFEVWDCFSLLSEKERKRVFSKIEKPGWCASLAVKPGVGEALGELRELVDVYAVTSPFHSPTWVHERNAWLVDNLGFTRAQIVHTSAKYLCEGDAFLDDNPDHTKHWREEHPGGLCMLWHIPNTRKLGFDDIRVRSWDEVLARVRVMVEQPRARVRQWQLDEYRMVMTWLLKDLSKIRHAKSPERMAAVRRARKLVMGG